MIKTIFVRTSVIARLESGPVGPYLTPLITTLQAQRYAPDTIRQYLNGADAFGRWLSRQGLAFSETDEATVNRYVISLGRQSYPSQINGRVHRAAIGLIHLLQVLREQGIITPRPALASTTPAQQWLEQYAHYLGHVLGSAPSTQQNYLLFANRFLSTFCGSGYPDWSSLRADTITKFVEQEAAWRTGAGRKLPATAIRALLRYLVMQREIPEGLEATIPTIREWKHASLPCSLSNDQIARLLQVSLDGTPIGLRNHAILLLLSRLALRAGEIRYLQLDDIDWVEGQILVRAGKTHRERNLPLPTDVGAALIDYLRQGRPANVGRVLFVQHKAPFLPLQYSATIAGIIRGLMARAGIESRSAGAHLFRHAAATNMVCRGTSFKAVADVLGHQSLQTTAIYAKLDFESLSPVALPWPGGAP